MSIPADHTPWWEERRRSTRIRSSSTPRSSTAVERLTDDLIVEILSRVPARSFYSFKCVSKRWLTLVNQPDYCKRLPQTLARFFHTDDITYKWLLEPPLLYTSVSGRCCPPIDTSFSFLPNHRRINLLDSCNGLLLCRWYDIATHGDESRYVVCNPATEQWVMLPDSGKATSKVGAVRLGFDSALSWSRFYVFELVEEQEDECHPDLDGVAVYSSETGGWVYKEIPWNEHVRHINHYSATIFLNGYLHFLVHDRELSDRLAVVDTKGEAWMNFGVPECHFDGFIQQSQGCLHYDNLHSNGDGVGSRLAVYVLDGYGSKEWILKHTVQTSYVFQGRDIQINGEFDWIAIYPECNLIFFTMGWNAVFMCYDMDCRQVKLISKLEGGEPPYMPYVPLYVELQSLHI